MKKIIFSTFLVILLVVSMTVLSSAGTIPADAFLFDDFSVTRGMNTNDKPAHNGAGLQCWWHNFNAGEVKNKECELKDGVLKVVYGFDMEDGEIYTWGNWGEAFDIHCTDSTGTKGDPECQDYKYFHITIKGAKGGEEKILIFNPAPEDEDAYSCFFDQLVLADGSHPKITTEWQTLKIDLAASGMPQVFNRFHIRSIKDGATIYLDELYWTEPDGTGKKPVPNQNFTKLATVSEIETRVAAFDKGTSASANPKTGDNSIIALVVIMLIAAAGILVLRIKKARA
ncbi:MAG: LPXTG cell wall anchor domain-containing protein [Acetivibrionales bacterium]|jgi:LPXTG-motif cell wall-anchored protein